MLDYIEVLAGQKHVTLAQEYRNYIVEYSFKERGGFRSPFFIVKIFYLPFSSG